VSDRYNYDEHKVQLDSQDSSKNSAQALAGYHLDVRLQPGWPGLDPDPNKLAFDSKQMGAIADRIDRLLDNLTSTSGAGTPQSILAKGVPSFGPSTWAAASYLQTATSQVAGTVAQYAQDLILNLQGAAQAIRTAIANHDKAEHANQQSGRNLQTSLTTTPTAF